MSGNWYYAKNGQRFGPFTFEQFRQMAMSGMLQTNDMVLDDATGKWQSAGSVTGMFTAAVSEDQEIEEPCSRTSSVAGFDTAMPSQALERALPKNVPPVIESGGPQTVVVSSSGEGQFRSINEAIRAATVPKLRILVRLGVYRESVLLDRDVEIFADGATDQVVIEAMGGPCVAMKTERAVVRGLTLRCTAGQQGKKFFAVDIPSGDLLLENCDIASDSRGCIAIYGPRTNPTIHNCKIHHSKECGVFVFNQARGTIEGCDIFANEGSGVAIKQGGDPTIRNCKIHHSKESSGVFVFKHGKGSIEGCEISFNKLSGIEIKEGGNPTISRCRINLNGGNAIWVFEGGSGTVQGCNFQENLGGPWNIARGCQVQRRDNQELPTPADLSSACPATDGQVGPSATNRGPYQHAEQGNASPLVVDKPVSSARLTDVILAIAALLSIPFWFFNEIIGRPFLIVAGFIWIVVSVRAVATGRGMSFTGRSSKLSTGYRVGAGLVGVLGLVMVIGGLVALNTNARSQGAMDAFNRGVQHGNKGDLDQAILAYSESIQIEAQHFETFVNRGIAYAQKKLYAKAIEDFTQAIRLMTGRQDKDELAMLYFNRGLCHSFTRSYDLAIADFSEAIRLKPDMKEAYSNREIAYREKKDLDRAKADRDRDYREKEKR
jgi:parallel beta-helix repeat protein